MSIGTSVDTLATTLGPLVVRRTGSGPPALLWHSLFVDSSTFDDVVGYLAGHRELFLVDGPGHGASPGPRRLYSLEDCARAATEILDTLGISGPADWVGNAWGGHVGIVAAHNFPARCRSLVTIGTPPYPLTRPERLKSAGLVYLYRLAGPQPFKHLMTEALLGKGTASTAPSAAATVEEAFCRGARGDKYWAMQSVMLHRPDLRATLSRLHTPTLMLLAGDDPMNNPEETERAVRSIPDGHFAVVPGGGHVAPLLIAPAEVAQHIVRFWHGIQDRRPANIKG